MRGMILMFPGLPSLTNSFFILLLNKPISNSEITQILLLAPPILYTRGDGVTFIHLITHALYIVIAIRRSFVY
jgi:hypothetical protein